MYLVTLISLQIFYDHQQLDSLLLFQDLFIHKKMKNKLLVWLDLAHTSFKLRQFWTNVRRRVTWWLLVKRKAVDENRVDRMILIQTWLLRLRLKRFVLVSKGEFITLVRKLFTDKTLISYFIGQVQFQNIFEVGH